MAQVTHLRAIETKETTIDRSSFNVLKVEYSYILIQYERQLRLTATATTTITNVGNKHVY